MVTSPFTPIDAAKGPTGVVIEVGAVFVRCGFAGEARPRHFLRTPATVRPPPSIHIFLIQLFI
jgi:hypothetical protein